MFQFQERLEKAGIADTRSPYLAQAIANLHSAIAACDPVNQRVFAEIYPYAVRAAVEFARIEQQNQDLWGVSDRDDWISYYDDYEQQMREWLAGNVDGGRELS